MTTFFCRLRRRMLLIFLLLLPLSLDMTGGEHGSGGEEYSLILSRGEAAAAPAGLPAMGRGISELRRGSGISELRREAEFAGCW
jgi:hypothetical protein